MELLKVDSLDSEGSSYTDPSSSASDSDAFSQSETIYKGKNLLFFLAVLLLTLKLFFPFPNSRPIKSTYIGCKAC